MSQWPTAKHFASWLRLFPNSRVTGGKVKRRNTLPCQNRAYTDLYLAAQSLPRSNSCLGAFNRRTRARHSPALANSATAPKIARIIYFMLKRREPYYDLAAEHYDQQH